MNRVIVAGRALLAVCVLLSVPQAAGAQAMVLRGAVGGAVQEGGGVKAGHALIEVSKCVTTRLDLRAHGFLAVGKLFYHGIEAVTGGGADFVVHRASSVVRPYAGVGVGYTHTSMLQGSRLRHDLGVDFVVGIDADIGQNYWFVDFRPRFFGNIFQKRAVTRSLFLLSVGCRF